MRTYPQYTGFRNSQNFVNSTPFGPAAFRPAGRRPVKGGRWYIRKGWGKRPWRAWSRGSAKRFNRSFVTHAEAIQHATLIAQMFADPSFERVNRTIRLALPNVTEETIAKNVLRYIRKPDKES